MRSSLPPQAVKWCALRSWTDAQLGLVSDRLTGRWAQWCGDWLPGHSTPAVTCVHAFEARHLTTSPWSGLGRRGDAVAWVDDAASTVRALFEAGPQPEESDERAGDIAKAVAHDAWLDANAMLQDLLQVDAISSEDECASSLFEPWSGAVVARLSFPTNEERHVLLNADSFETLAGAAGLSGPERAARLPLAPLTHALSSHRLAVRAEFTSCELDLGSLADLRVGDVIPLPHSLDTPLYLTTAQRVPVCSGYLGRADGFKAVELVRRPAPSISEGPVYDPLSPSINQ